MPSRPRFQFGLFWIMVAIAAVGLSIVYWRPIVYGIWQAYAWIVLVAALGAFWFGGVVRSTRLNPFALGWRRRIGALLALTTTFAGVYSLWAIDRWHFALWEDPTFPVPLPYPDDIVLSFYEWRDSLEPPLPPGYFRIRGPIHEVEAWLHLASLLIWTTAAFLFGLILRRPKLPQISLGQHEFALSLLSSGSGEYLPPPPRRDEAIA